MRYRRQEILIEIILTGIWLLSEAQTRTTWQPPRYNVRHSRPADEDGFTTQKKNKEKRGFD